MSSQPNLPAVYGDPQHSGHHTFGCLDPIDIAPLDALLDDVRRTYAHIMWLEAYIAQLEPDNLFIEMTADLTREHEVTRMGKPTVVGSVKWQLEVNRKRQTATKGQRQRTHPAILTLQAERKHLADITTKAIALGIKLDQIDYSRQQADMIIEAMGHFALTSGLSPTAPDIQQRITDALEFVLARQTQQANQAGAK